MRAARGTISVNINLPLTTEIAQGIQEELELDDGETRVSFIRAAIIKEIMRRKLQREKIEAAE